MVRPGAKRKKKKKQQTDMPVITVNHTHHQPLVEDPICVETMHTRGNTSNGKVVTFGQLAEKLELSRVGDLALRRGLDMRMR